MSKRYELLKDYFVNVGPLIPKGEIIEWSIDGSRLYWSSKYQYPFSKEFVEKNPSWFKPIEDKEPTAFQWTDYLVKEILALYWDKPVADLSKTLDFQIKKFKEESKLYYSIPAGKGTANETINDNVGVFRDSYKFSDNPVLDRQDKESSVNGASAEYGGFHDEKPERPWATSKSFKDNVIESFEEKFKAEGIQEYPTYNRQCKEIERWDLKWEYGRAVLNRNDDGKWRLVEYNDCNGFWYSEKKYEEDLKKSFEAGRQSIGPVNYDRNGFKFPTFQDYKTSKLKSNDSR